jgi:type IV secretory pathway TrbF-like protein
MATARRIGERVGLHLPPFLIKRLGRAAAPDGTSATPPTRVSESSPFLAARTEFTNAFGDLARGKRNWQVIAYALVGLLALVTIAEVRLAASARVVPYVVEVDRLGQVVGVGPAEALREPEERLIVSELAQFVRAIRTVLPAAAAAAQGELLRRGYAFVAPRAATFLNGYFAKPEHDPRLLGLRLARQVDVASVLRVPHSDVWRLRWTETERSIEPGGLMRTVAWEGYLTVTLVPPTTADVLQENPLGLSITSVSWTQVTETSPFTTNPDAGATP